MIDGRHTVSRQAIFADTSFFFALMVDGDERHGDARAVYRGVLSERRQVVTSNLVLIELHSLMTRRIRAAFATAALFSLESSSLRIIRATHDDDVRARNILRTYTDKEFSLLDATSFAVMERLNLSTALSFDRHFRQYGLTVLGA